MPLVRSSQLEPQYKRAVKFDSNSCCTCGGGAQGGPKNATGTGGAGAGAGAGAPGLPLICLVPRDTTLKGADKAGGGQPGPPAASTAGSDMVQLLDENYIKKHFKLPARALYLDPFRRPLITFPMTQEEVSNFNMARKNKINQQILDGFLHPSEAISAPSVFPYAKPKSTNSKESQEDEEIIYILQLPDWEFICPTHNQPIRTPRFIWHSVKKSSKESDGKAMKQGGGPMNKPKPWLLSRHTDFDLMSQW